MRFIGRSFRGMAVARADRCRPLATRSGCRGDACTARGRKRPCSPPSATGDAGIAPTSLTPCRLPTLVPMRLQRKQLPCVFGEDAAVEMLRQFGETRRRVVPVPVGPVGGEDERLLGVEGI